MHPAFAKVFIGLADFLLKGEGLADGGFVAQLARVDLGMLKTAGAGGLIAE